MRWGTKVVNLGLHGVISHINKTCEIFLPSTFLKWCFLPFYWLSVDKIYLVVVATK